MKQKIIIGTRASKLAMTQTLYIVERLRQQWPTLDIVIEQIRTTGDRIANVPLSQIGGDGVFVKEIQHALHEQRIDLAVHSLKDLPTAPTEGLCIVVVGPREDVRDVFISHSTYEHLEDNDSISASCLTDCLNEARHESGVGGLNNKSLRIGTSSLRRTAQIRKLYPHAHILPLRGNVDTRLRKLEAGDYDAIVLASAGLHRLEMHHQLAERLTYLPIAMMMPAPGQGALALEIRDEAEMRDLLEPLNDRDVQAATSAERMFMRRLGAGCYLPVAAYGEINDEIFTLSGLVISLDGQRHIRVQQHMPWTINTTLEQAGLLGVQVAEQALAQGAYEIIDQINAVREQEHQHV